MKRYRCIGLVVALLLASAAGCRLTERFKVHHVRPPVAKVTAVTVTERTDEAVRLEITIELTSVGDLALPLVDAKYTVNAAGAAPATFSSNPNRTLPAGGSQTITLPAVLTTAEGLSVGTPATVTGSIVYEPPGEIRQLMTESKVPLPSVSFRYSGQLQ